MQHIQICNHLNYTYSIQLTKIAKLGNKFKSNYKLNIITVIISDYEMKTVIENDELNLWLL